MLSLGVNCQFTLLIKLVLPFLTKWETFCSPHGFQNPTVNFMSLNCFSKSDGTINLTDDFSRLILSPLGTFLLQEYHHNLENIPKNIYKSSFYNSM